MLFKERNNLISAPILLFSFRTSIAKIFNSLAAYIFHSLNELNTIDGTIGQSVEYLERFCIFILLLWLFDVSSH